MSMQRVVNYGSYLQAYSLKQIIESLGGKVEFVDYRVEKCIGEKRITVAKRRFKKTKLWLFAKKYIFRRSQRPIAEHKRKFIEYLAELGVCPKRNVRPKLDLLVIGSDEVFNCLQKNLNVGYSLELFGKKHRAKKLISYAASFGNTTLERLEQYGKEKEIGYYLNRFDALSVRDRNSGCIVEKLSSIVPEYHLDPVLIGNFENIETTPIGLENYIIVYGYTKRFTEEEGKSIIAYAEAHGKAVISICGKQLFVKDHIYCSPKEVLSYFKYADAVITDTFHGSIFSIIMHRPFVTVIRDSADGSYGNREKLEDMMIRMHMEDRIIKSMSELSNVMDNHMDFSLSDEIRAKEREKTISYLKKYIN